MGNDERERSPVELWKSQEEERMQISVAEVCVKARKYERENVVVYRALLLVAPLLAAAFIYNLTRFRNAWLIVGTVWALATLSCMVWGFWKGPARMSPEEPCLHFLRREFERKRRTFQRMRWGALSMFPAILASSWGGGPMLRARALGIPPGWLMRALGGHWLLLIWAVVLAFIWFAFWREGRKVEREIERLGRE